MEGMRRAAASFALLSLLACSSAGVCWAEVVRSAHACCESAPSVSPAKACASTVDAAAPILLAVPAEHHPAPVAAFTVTELRPVSAFAPAFHVLPPPLVLRI